MEVGLKGESEKREREKKKWGEKGKTKNNINIKKEEIKK